MRNEIRVTSNEYNKNKYLLSLRVTRYALLFWIFMMTLSPCRAEYVPGEIIVKFKSPVISLPSSKSLSAMSLVSIRSEKLKNIFRSIKVSKIEKAFPDELPPKASIKIMDGKSIKMPDLTLIHRLFIPKDSNIEKTIELLKNDPDVEYAQPNYIYHAFLTPNDPYFSLQWGLKNISAEAGWNASTGTSEVIVGIVDTGVDYTHEDLSGKVILGHDYANSDNDPMDDNGHGTHLAGVIGAITNNGTGIAGINWNGRILAVKSLDSAGDGLSLNVARGIKYAANNSAKVINMSFGQSADDPTIKEAIITAYSQGCVLVAAAGNSATQALEYPAAYTDYVIAVAATDQNDKRSVWSKNPNTGASQESNYGTWVDVCAPGTLVYSTWLNTKSPFTNYAYENGTSMATPHVAALASLIWSQDSTYTQTDVRTRIENSCDNIDPLNPGFEGLLGHGRINVATALGLPVSRITSPTNASYVSGTIEVDGTATSNHILDYQVLVGTGYPATLFQTLIDSPTGVNNGKLCTFDTNIKNDGLHSLKLICRSNNALTSETTVKIIIDNTDPVAQISSLSNGATISGTVEIIGTASDMNLVYYTLSYAKDSDYIQITNSATSATSAILGVWNTYGLSGTYNLKLYALDAAGHSTTKIINVNIIAASQPEQSNISGIITSTPNPFNLSLQSSTYLSYSLAKNSSILIYLFNMNGELIFSKSYASGDNGGKSGNNLVPWDGHNSSGQFVGNGVYFYKILDVTDNSKKVIGSGRIIVIR